MEKLPATVTKSRIWQKTLAQQPEDQSELERARLRNTFATFRDRAAHLSNEIRKDLPALTVHDVTHMDALWEVASVVAGEKISFTPTESFVLGCAFLLHDLAMSVAATEGGMQAIRKDPRWSDLIFAEYRSSFNRDPTKAEQKDPDAAVGARALFALLRQIHAENGEKLAFLSYPATDKSPLFLIEDAEIRQGLGRLIGKIAHSHWWSIVEVERSFDRIIGAPH